MITNVHDLLSAATRGHATHGDTAAASAALALQVRRFRIDGEVTTIPELLESNRGDPEAEGIAVALLLLPPGESYIYNAGAGGLFEYFRLPDLEPGPRPNGYTLGLGQAPANERTESRASVFYDAPRARARCRLYAQAIRGACGREPEGARLVTRDGPAGEQLELEVTDSGNEIAMCYAARCAKDAPKHWPEDLRRTALVLEPPEAWKLPQAVTPRERLLRELALAARDGTLDGVLQEAVAESESLAVAEFDLVEAVLRFLLASGYLRPGDRLIP